MRSKRTQSCGYLKVDKDAGINTHNNDIIMRKKIYLYTISYKFRKYIHQKIQNISNNELLKIFNKIRHNFYDIIKINYLLKHDSL